MDQNLIPIIKRTRDLELALTRKVAQRDTLASQKQALEETQSTLQVNATLYASVMRLLDLFVKSTEVNVKGYLEPLVTEALDFVFAQSLRFHLLFTTRRNQVEIDFIVLRNDEMEALYQQCLGDPEKYARQLEQLVKGTKQIDFMYGGAVSQVIALVLRLILAELLHIEGPIFLDEPSSAVGEEYSARLGQLLSSFSERFNRQYVLVTHSHSLASYADILYEVEQVDGVSNVSQRN